jgi:hypothetical protein
MTDTDAQRIVGQLLDRAWRLHHSLDYANAPSDLREKAFLEITRAEIEAVREVKLRHDVLRIEIAPSAYAGRPPYIETILGDRLPPEIRYLPPKGEVWFELFGSRLVWLGK